MRARLRIYLFAADFCFLLAACATHATAQRYHFINYSSKQGLPSHECFQVIQDGKGYLWICTEYGVSRFDGKNFKTFSINNGVPDNTVLRIYEDRFGRIWFFGFSGGIAYYENGKVHPLACNNELRDLLKGRSVINSYYVDSTGSLYVHGTMDVMLRIRPENNYGRLEKITHDDTARMILSEFNPGEFFFTAHTMGYKRHNNISHRKGGQSQLIRIDSVQSSSFKFPTAAARIFTRIKNDIYFAANNLLYRIRDGQARVYREFTTRITYLYADPSGGLWVCAVNNGAFYFRDPESASKPEQFLREYTATSVCFDHEGSIWISTLEKGIFYTRTLGLKVLTTEDGLKDNRINELFFLDSMVVFGYDKSPYLTTLNFFNDSVSISTSTLPGSESYASHVIRHGEYKIGVGRNISIMKNGAFFASYIPTKIISYYETFIINDTLFCAYNFGAITFFDLKGITREMLTPIRITTGLVTADGRILFGTINGIWEYRNDTLVPLEKEYPELASKKTRIRETSNGNIVAVTSDMQVLLLTPAGKKSGEVPASAFPPGSIRNDIFCDDQHIYIAANNGLYIITRNTIGSATGPEILHLGTFTGFPVKELKTALLFRDRIFISSKEGIAYLPHKIIRSIKSLPKVDIERVITNSDSLYNYPRALTINYPNNRIQIVFNGISFSSQGNLKYMIMLQGYDTAWQRTHVNEMNYNNLPPGDYTFRVYVIDEGGSKSGEKTFSFTILRPFWMTWWFLALNIAVFLGATALVVKRIVNNIRLKEKKKTELNRMLSEFQLTALKSQMNPHFLFNCINSIQHLIITGKNEEAYTYLDKFSSLVRFILEYSQKDFVLLAEEVKFLNSYLELERLRFDNKFGFSINTSDLDPSKVGIPSMVLQPFIENALWHGLLPSKEEKHLLIQFEKTNGHLRITIEDNGIGLNEGRKKERQPNKSSIGIRNTIDRLALFKQRSGVNIAVDITDLRESNSGKGTRVVITLPLIHVNQEQ